MIITSIGMKNDIANMNMKNYDKNETALSETIVFTAFLKT